MEMHSSYSCENSSKAADYLALVTPIIASSNVSVNLNFPTFDQCVSCLNIKDFKQFVQ